MDGSRFDALTRSFNPEPATRRRALRLLLGAIAGGAGMASAADSTARHRKRKRKSHCPADRRCGKKCCPKGKICAGGVCVIGQGACPTGADVCAGGAEYVSPGQGNCAAPCLVGSASVTIAPAGTTPLMPR
ncbi:MAG TPA: hypothetical protein VFX03_13705 [Thermomicrobiales bacterium]|nr:hypothetical protein [Thermomicrobiales bacterium]